MTAVSVSFTLNGRKVKSSVSPTVSLLNFLRGEMQATEVKNGCERGDCGACVVFMDGVLVNSCLVLAAQISGCEILTVKGIGSRKRLHPVQESFVAHGAVQCGFCTPGMVLAVKALLDENPNPTEEEIRRGIAGNLCRCTGYLKIIRAASDAARMLTSERPT